MCPWTSRPIGFGFLALVLCVPALRAAPAQPQQAYPGMLNYVEGQASIGGQALNPGSAGSAELQVGQTLTTENGRVEILLTPGVFLRLDHESSVQLVSADLLSTEVALRAGRATLEVAEFRPENELRIDQNSASTEPLKTGFYQFDADLGRMRVFSGKAVVLTGDRQIKVKGGRELDLNSTGRIKAAKFDKKSFDADDLDRWSSLRSAYVSEANQDASADYEMAAYWFDGWYWDPWFDCFAFIPADGIFFSPFGWGFYSPWWVGVAPLYHAGRYSHHFDGNTHNWGPGPHLALAHSVNPFHASGRARSLSFGRMAGGFRGGSHFGGGFHGGGGGFHGGGGGGGHGGGRG